MSRNRLLVGGLVIVAVLVIAYFAFVYPPASKEDTSGAIGVANKYRSEQITDRDVMLKDEEAAAAAAMAVMSPDEKAAMFERSSADLQARTLVQNAPEVIATALGRADDATLARTFKTMDAQARVELFARAPKPTQDALCKGMNVTSERFANFSMDEKAARLAKAPDMDLAAMIKKFDLQQKTDFFAKADFTSKNDVIKYLDRSDRVKVMERAPAPVLAEMERTNFKANYFGRTAPDQQHEMLAKSPEIIATALGRADDATLARTFKTMDAQARVELFARAPKPTQDALCKGMNVTSERFANFSMDEKAARLAKAPDMDLAAMIKKFDLQQKTDFFAKADFTSKNDVIKYLDRSDRVKVMERAPAPVLAEMERTNFKANYFGRTAPDQQHEMLAKSPEIIATALGRADDATLARTFKTMDAQARVELFARAPKPTQDALCKGMNVTSERFANFSMDEKAARLAKAPDMDLAAMIKKFDLQQKTDFFAKADFASRNDVIKLTSRTERADAMERAPAKVAEAMERAISDMERSSTQRRNR